MFERVLGKKHPGVANCMTCIAVCYSVRGEYDRAEDIFREALEIGGRAVGQQHRNLASTYSKLAVLHRRKGDFAHAESFFTQSLEIYRSSVSDENNDVAYNLYQLADLYRDTARLDRAEPLYQRAVKIQQRALGPSHIHLAASISGLARLYAKQGKSEDARELYDRSLVVAKRAVAGRFQNLRAQAQLAVIHLGSGDLHHSLANEKRARQAWRQALAASEVVTRSTDVVDFLDTHCRALLRLGRIEEARPIVDRLLAIGWCAPEFLDLCRQHGLAAIPTHGEDRPSDRRER